MIRPKAMGVVVVGLFVINSSWVRFHFGYDGHDRHDVWDFLEKGLFLGPVKHHAHHVYHALFRVDWLVRWWNLHGLHGLHGVSDFLEKGVFLEPVKHRADRADRARSSGGSGLSHPREKRRRRSHGAKSVGVSGGISLSFCDNDCFDGLPTVAAYFSLPIALRSSALVRLRRARSS
jgi:hypothetical protein